MCLTSARNSGEAIVAPVERVRERSVRRQGHSSTANGPRKVPEDFGRIWFGIVKKRNHIDSCAQNKVGVDKHYRTHPSLAPRAPWWREGRRLPLPCVLSPCVLCCHRYNLVKGPGTEVLRLWANDTFLPSISVCMSLCVHTCMCGYMYKYMGVCMEAEGQCWESFSIGLHFNFWGQSLSLNPELANLTRCLASKSQGSSWLHVTGAVMTGMQCCA